MTTTEFNSVWLKFQKDFEAFKKEFIAGTVTLNADLKRRLSVLAIRLDNIQLEKDINSKIKQSWSIDDSNRITSYWHSINQLREFLKN